MKLKKIMACLLATALIVCGIPLCVNADSEQWSALRGYSGNTGSVSDSGTVATLTGYGAATYDRGFSFEEGDFVTVTLSGMSLAASTENQIDLLFLDQGNSFFNNVNDAGTGLRVNLTSWGSLNGFRLKYCDITAGQKGTETSFSKQISSALATSAITYTLTKKTQTINAVDYTFVLSVSVTNSSGTVTNGEQSVNIPASVLAANVFENGVYLSTGNQAVSTAAYSNVYTITHPIKSAGKWTRWKNTMTVENITDGVTVNASSGTGAASLQRNETLTFARKDILATDITFALAGNTANTAIGVAFTTVQNMYYAWDDSTGYALGVQFSNANGIQYFYCNNGSRNFANISGTIGFNKAADGLTYTVKLIDNGNSGYTIQVKLNNTEYSVNVPLANMPAHALAGNIYCNTGNRTTLSSGTYTVSNPVKSAIPTDFVPVRGYGLTEGSGTGLTETDESTTFVGYGGTAYTADVGTSAAAIDFQLNEYPQSGSWFCIGLVNQANVFWATNGSESQGLVALITPFSNGNGINVNLKNVTSSGLVDLGTINSTVAARDTTHTLSFYQIGSDWHVALDSNKSITVAKANVELDDDLHLVVGANGSSTMEMTVEDVRFDSAVSVSDYGVADSFAGYTLTLEGDIGMNFFAYDALLSDSNTVTFTWDDKTVGPLALSTFQKVSANGNSCYKLTCGVPAKEINQTITATIKSGNQVLAAKEYSIAQYATRIIANEGGEFNGQPNLAALQNLMRAMLVYGAKSQLQFDYDTDSLADAGLDLSTYTAADITEAGLTKLTYQGNAAIAGCGLQYEGCTLVLKSKTYFRLGFSVTDEDLFAASTVSLGGTPLTATDNSTLKVYTVLNIAAADLLKPITLRFGENEVVFCVSTYMASVMSKEDTPDNITLKNTIQALYDYHQKAVAYFG